MTLLACTSLTGCLGGQEQSAVEALPVSAAISEPPVAAVSFLPIGGVKSQIPLSIDATLASNVQSAGTVDQVTAWAMSCSGVGAYTVQNVSLSGLTATILLSQSKSPANGETCTLLGSALARDKEGNPLSVMASVTYTLDNVGPTVIAQSIASGQIAVPVLASLLLTFDESVASATLNASNFQLRAHSTGTLVPGSISYRDPLHVVTFTPTANFALGTQYEVHLSGVQDDYGNSMAADLDFSFTTAP